MSARFPCGLVLPLAPALLLDGARLRSSAHVRQRAPDVEADDWHRRLADRNVDHYDCRHVDHYDDRHVDHYDDRHVDHYDDRHVDHYDDRHVDHFAGHHVDHYVDRHAGPDPLPWRRRRKHGIAAIGRRRTTNHRFAILPNPIRWIENYLIEDQYCGCHFGVVRSTRNLPHVTHPTSILPPVTPQIAEHQIAEHQIAEHQIVAHLIESRQIVSHSCERRSSVGHPNSGDVMSHPMTGSDEDAGNQP